MTVPRKPFAFLALAAIFVGGVLWGVHHRQLARREEAALGRHLAWVASFQGCHGVYSRRSDTLLDKIRRSHERSRTARWLDSLLRTHPDADREELALDLLGPALLGHPEADSLLDALIASRGDSLWRKEVEYARWRSGSPRGLQALEHRADSLGVRDWPGYFRILGELDTQARALVKHVDRGLAGGQKHAFLRSLGWTRDTFWRARLEQALMDPTNWLCQSSAAIALGDLGDQRSIGVLQAQASSHWHLQVRQAASQALERIARGDSLAIPDWNADLLLHGLFEFNMPPGEPSVRNDSLQPLRPCRTLDSKELGKSIWGAVLHGWADGPTTRPIRQAALVSAPWGEGWLLGASRGEWGGEFAWRSPDGEIEVLDSLPVDTFLCTDHGILTMTAGGHFGAVGELSQVVGGPQGRPKRIPFRLLPGSGCRWGMRGWSLVFRCSHGEMPLSPPLRDGSPSHPGR